MKHKFNIGDRVKDTITNQEGTVISIHLTMGGITYEVTTLTKDGKIDETWMHESRLIRF